MSARSVDRPLLGIALDGTLLTAAWRSARGSQNTGAGAWRTLVVPCDGTPASVVGALQEVAAAVPARDEVAFTLLRPLATTRTIAFPAMKRAELEAVLARDWARYVIGLRAEPHVASAERAQHGAWRATFAPASTLEALDSAALAHGWQVRDARTSDDALAAAACHALPTMARMEDAVVVLCGAGGATDVVRLHLGDAVSGRQLLSGTASEIATFMHASARSRATAPATVLLIGDAERGETLARELGRDGLRAQYSPLPQLATDSPAALLAAGALLRRTKMPLVSPVERVTRQRRARVATRWLAVAAVLLVAAGIALESNRLTRELDGVARERATIVSKVGDAVARRARLESATESAAALAEHEAQASHASTVLATLVLALPENTALSMLQVSGDSVTIEGESDRSADVYAALRTAPTLEEVRLAGPLRQERQADDEPVEHFAFVARLKRGTR
jgi:hypothetical protein